MRRIAVTSVMAVLCATSAGAVSETCREWQDEHAAWTVTAADDGSPVAGAVLEVREACIGDCTTRSKPLTFSLNATPPKAGLPVVSPK